MQRWIAFSLILWLAFLPLAEGLLSAQEALQPHTAGPASSLSSDVGNRAVGYSTLQTTLNQHISTAKGSVSAQEAARVLGRAGATRSQANVLLNSEMDRGRVLAPQKSKGLLERIPGLKVRSREDERSTDLRRFTEGSVQANPNSDIARSLQATQTRLDLMRAQSAGLHARVQSGKASEAERVRLNHLQRDLPRLQKAQTSLKRQAGELQTTRDSVRRFAGDTLKSVGIRTAIITLTQALNGEEVDPIKAASFVAEPSYWTGVLTAKLGGRIFSAVGEALLPGAGKLVSTAIGTIGGTLGYQAGAGTIHQVDWANLALRMGANIAISAFLGGPIGVVAKIAAHTIMNVTMDSNMVGMDTGSSGSSGSSGGSTDSGSGPVFSDLNPFSDSVPSTGSEFWEPPDPNLPQVLPPPGLQQTQSQVSAGVTQVQSAANLRPRLKLNLPKIPEKLKQDDILAMRNKLDEAYEAYAAKIRQRDPDGARKAYAEYQKLRDEMEALHHKILSDSDSGLKVKASQKD